MPKLILQRIAARATLALFHHGLHRLTETKLAALTAVHNAHTRRPDGPPPADRFLASDHPNLFSTLVKRTPHIARPTHPEAQYGVDEAGGVSRYARNDVQGPSCQVK